MVSLCIRISVLIYGPIWSVPSNPASKVAKTLRVAGGLVERGDKKFYEDTRIFADPELFEILTIPFLKGGAQSSLDRPYTLVISDRMAKKYFGEDEPLGQTLLINSRDYFISSQKGVRYAEKLF